MDADEPVRSCAYCRIRQRTLCSDGIAARVRRHEFVARVPPMSSSASLGSFDTAAKPGVANFGAIDAQPPKIRMIPQRPHTGVGDGGATQKDLV